MPFVRRGRSRATSGWDPCDDGRRSGYDESGGSCLRTGQPAHGQLVVMSATTKIAMGVTAGYLLGRMRKLRLAITVGGLLAGQRVATNPQALLSQGNKLIENNPELRKLRGEITGRLLDAARDAAILTASSRLESMTESLTALPGMNDEDQDEYDDEDEYDEDEDEDDVDESQDEAESDESDRKPRRRRSRAAAASVGSGTR